MTEYNKDLWTSAPLKRKTLEEAWLLKIKMGVKNLDLVFAEALKLLKREN